MPGDKKEEKLRCYVIADDYRWHFLTDSIEEFEIRTKAYLELMNNSAKENQYYFKNVFLDREEYLRILKNIMYNSRNILKINPDKEKKEPHLYLVD